jgi:hypothetical protein
MTRQRREGPGCPSTYIEHLNASETQTTYRIPRRKATTTKDLMRIVEPKTYIFSLFLFSKGDFTLNGCDTDEKRQVVALAEAASHETYRCHMRAKANDCKTTENRIDRRRPDWTLITQKEDILDELLAYVSRLAST